MTTVSDMADRHNAASWGSQSSLDEAHRAAHRAARALLDGRHVGPSPGRTIEQDFAAFHAANPLVLIRLEQLARQWRRRHPSKRIGVKTLYERLRWEVEMEATPDAQGFKLNNSFTALYAREIMRSCPDLAEPPIFETRSLRITEED